MARDLTREHDYDHPERLIEGCVFAPNGCQSDEIKAQRQSLRKMMTWTPTDKALCRACGWTDYHELCTSYIPRIKVFHARANMGLWSLGSKWFIKDQPNDASLGNEYMTYQFLSQQPGLSIPLIETMQRLTGPTDPVHFTLMSRAEGVPLADIWYDLSPEEKLSYSKQMATAIRQLRQFTAPFAQNVEGGELDDCVIGTCRRHPPTCLKLGRNTEEWFENLRPTLRRGLASELKTEDPEILDMALKTMKDNFPSGGPYVLTHADLNLSNILVKDDRITAIIDWEMAGYYPWWVERWYILAKGAPGADELFEPVWEELCPDMSLDAFKAQIGFPVLALSNAWKACPRQHPEFWTAWLRPGFCECQPYAGASRWMDLGHRLEHCIEPYESEKKAHAESASAGPASDVDETLAAAVQHAL